jgi:hypothetical protein
MMDAINSKQQSNQVQLHSNFMFKQQVTKNDFMLQINYLLLCSNVTFPVRDSVIETFKDFKNSFVIC